MRRSASRPKLLLSQLLLGAAAALLQFLPVTASAEALSSAPFIKVQALLNGKAVLQIGDAPGRLLRVGESEQGVKLLAADTTSAEVLVNGKKKRLSLSMGTLLQPSVVSSLVVRPYIPKTDEPAAAAGSMTLSADAGGHFRVPGQVNGKPVSFLVDTGASLVVLTEAQAKLAGYTLDDGRPVNSATANGTALNYLINVPSLKLGSLRFSNVKALIAPSFEGPEALLGSNVLKQMRMQQQGNQLTLSALPPTPAGKASAAADASSDELP